MKVLVVSALFTLLSSGWFGPNLASGCECLDSSIYSVLNPYVSSNGISLEGDCFKKTKTVVNHMARRATAKYSTFRSETYKVLMERIQFQSSDVGIWSEGSIDGRTRLLNLLEYYEDRHAQKIEQIRNLKSKKNDCKGQTVETEMDSLQQNHTANLVTISELQNYRDCLRKQRKILEAKLSSNSQGSRGSNKKDCVLPIGVDLTKLSDGSKLEIADK